MSTGSQIPGRRALWLMMALCIGILPDTARAQQLLEGIAARVDNHLLLWSEVRRESLSAQFSRSATASPADTRERMIEDMLVADEAKRLKLAVGDTEVDQSIDRLAKDNNLNRAALQAEIARQGITWESYRNMVSRQLLRSRIIQTQIRPKVVLGESDIQAAWDRINKGKGLVEVHLALRDASGASTDLGWNQPSRLREELRIALAKAKHDKSTEQEVVLDGKTWIIQILETRIPEKQMDDDSREALRQELFQQRLEKAFANWLTSLKSRHFVERNPLPHTLK